MVGFTIFKVLPAVLPEILLATLLVDLIAAFVLERAAETLVFAMAMLCRRLDAVPLGVGLSYMVKLI